MKERVEAVLTTRCGCTRRVPTTFPPPPDILLPLAPRDVADFVAPDPSKPMALQRRRFALRNTEGPFHESLASGPGHFYRAEYVEVSP